MGTNPKMKFVLFFVALAFVAAVDAAPADGKVFGKDGLGAIQANLAKLPPLASDLNTMEEKLTALSKKDAVFKDAADSLQPLWTLKTMARAPKGPNRPEGKENWNNKRNKKNIRWEYNFHHQDYRSFCKIISKNDFIM